jgi:hypothetical protein
MYDLRGEKSLVFKILFSFEKVEEAKFRDISAKPSDLTRKYIPSRNQRWVC